MSAAAEASVAPAPAAAPAPYVAPSVAAPAPYVAPSVAASDIGMRVKLGTITPGHSGYPNYSNKSGTIIERNAYSYKLKMNNRSLPDKTFFNFRLITNDSAPVPTIGSRVRINPLKNVNPFSKYSGKEGVVRDKRFGASSGTFYTIELNDGETISGLRPYTVTQIGGSRRKTRTKSRTMATRKNSRRSSRRASTRRSSRRQNGGARKSSCKQTHVIVRDGCKTYRRVVHGAKTKYIKWEGKNKPLGDLRGKFRYLDGPLRT